MNQSVATYKLKTNKYCRTTLLQTRVGIAAGAMCVGYFYFWDHVFSALELDMDDVFASSLRLRDVRKLKKD